MTNISIIEQNRILPSIGGNFKNEWQHIANPASSYYVPDSATSMSCQMLDDNLNKLNSQIIDWTNKLNGANKASSKNLSKIISYQQGKADGYTSMIGEQCGTPKTVPTALTNSPVTATTNTATSGSGNFIKSNTALIGVAIVALIFIFKKKKA